MEMYISEELSRILNYAKEEAMRTGAYQINAGHMLLGLIRDRDNEACRVLVESGADLEECKRYLEVHLFRQGKIPYEDEDKISLGRSAENTFNMTVLEAKMEGVGKIDERHLLLALCRCPEEECKGCFKMAGIDRKTIESRFAAKATPESPGNSIEEVTQFQFNFLEVIEKNNKILN